MLDRTAVLELGAVAERVETDNDVRVVVFQSANPDFFVAHFDITDVYDVTDSAPKDVRELNFFQLMIERWRRLSKISIAKVAGICRGAGTEFISGLDMCYADRDRAVFALPEMMFGFPPGGGSCQYVGRRIGLSRALEMVLRAQDYAADQCEKWSLVTRALPTGELDMFVNSLALSIGVLPVTSVAAAKRMVTSVETPLSQALCDGNADWVESVRDPLHQAYIKSKTEAFFAAGGQTIVEKHDYPEIVRAMAAAG
jgi:enoyl-CoA hydratase/carnithine racemase